MKRSSNGYKLIESQDDLTNHGLKVIGTKAGDYTAFTFLSQESADAWMRLEISEGNADSEDWFSFSAVDDDTFDTFGRGGQKKIVTNEV